MKTFALFILIASTLAAGHPDSVRPTPSADSPTPSFEARERFLESLRFPRDAYWRRLEALSPAGRYQKLHPIREMRNQVRARPAFLPFERAFASEIFPDERIFQARDAMARHSHDLSSPGVLFLQGNRALPDDASSSLDLHPRIRLQQYLSRRILSFWLLRDRTNLEEIVQYQNLRETLLDQGQDETPDEFEERRIRDKRRLQRFEPLKHFRMRTMRDLMDARAQHLQKQWRNRTPSFSPRTP
ncbi:MAG TPA: hypothetical protein PLB62_08900 [Candidatus Sumerlaeota bacterium]|nr:hypothetical protein [Candidatus Sumerlaeota bacterium]